MKTTLTNIKACKPCDISWRKLLESLNKTEADDTEVSITYILDLLGLDDALWALRAVEGHDKEIRLLACDYAERVLPIFEKEFPDDKRPRQAIEVASQYANGEATKKELGAARLAAWAAGNVAWAAAIAGVADSHAAWGAARAAYWAAADSHSARVAAWVAGDVAWAAIMFVDLDNNRQWQEQRLREVLENYKGLTIDVVSLNEA